MKKRLAFFLIVSLVFGTTTTALAETKLATPSSATVVVDDQEMIIGAYTIDGYTYFKLRDVATILSDTNSRFAVGYDADTRSISLTTNSSYTATGSELGNMPTESVFAEIATQSLILNENPISISTYNIEGNTYFQLRELGDMIGFDVVWNNETKTIQLETAKLSTADLQEIVDASDDTQTILLDGVFQGEDGDSIVITKGCTLLSETNATLNSIAIVVDTTETVSLSGITFNGNYGSDAGLQLVSVGADTTIENCTFNYYEQEALSIYGIPRVQTLSIKNCIFHEYGLAEGGVDGAISLDSDREITGILDISNNYFSISRADSDMTADDMDVAFMTSTTKDADVIFGQLCLYFVGNTIVKGDDSYSIDIYAVFKNTASRLE